VSAGDAKAALERAMALWGCNGKVDGEQRKKAQQALRDAVNAGVLDTELRDRATQLGTVLR
jgi:hypothetical protein